MLNFLKRKYKIPLVNKGKPNGLFCEFEKGDSTYNTIIKAYGKIPKEIEVTPLK